MTTIRKKSLLAILFACLSLNLVAQTKILNLDSYLLNQNVPENGLFFTLDLEKGKSYILDVEQNGVDVILYLKNEDGDLLQEVDSPSGQYGTEQIFYQAKRDIRLQLEVLPFVEDGPAGDGVIDVRGRTFSKSAFKTWKAEQKKIAKISKNTVLTQDIVHFWEAYDSLKQVSTSRDSLRIIQELYIDRATEGFKQFRAVRPEMNAVNYLMSLRAFPKFYASLRDNSFICLDAEKAIDQVYKGFENAYGDFKPFKVCFAIGVLSTGGTVTDEYVLIGADITCSTKNMDLSEFTEAPYDQLLPHLSYEGNVKQKIKNIVAHECVHTQQPYLEEEEVSCSLLHACLSEGFCDFVGEIIVGEQINAALQTYGDEHEEELWSEFSSDLCNSSLEKWLYNYGYYEDRPADLGYYIGYRVAKAYYAQAKDKRAALKELIEFRDAKAILKASQYEDLPK